jgi:hypothetical protein
MKGLLTFEQLTKRDIILSIYKDTVINKGHSANHLPSQFIG